MNTTEQAEFLSSIMQELEADPEYPEEEKRVIKASYDFIKPLLGPQKLYAGYDAGYYYIRLNLETKMGTIAKLQGAGYTLHLLKPPFAEPIMLKKRD